MRKHHARVLKSKTIIGLMIFSVLLLSGLYIVQTNIEISERFLVQDYTDKVSKLSKENKTLEIDSAQASSLQELAQLIMPLNFEKIENIRYIKVLGAQAVAR